jgi:hypothetical protein
MLRRIRLKVFVVVVVVVVVVRTVTSSDSSPRHEFYTISVPVKPVIDIMALSRVSVVVFRFTLVTVNDSNGQYAVSHRFWEHHNEERSFL